MNRRLAISLSLVLLLPGLVGWVKPAIFELQNAGTRVGDFNKVNVTGGTATLTNGVATIPVGTVLGSGTANQVPYWTSSSNLSALGAMTNGQLIIGSTGATPVVAALTGTTNQVSVTNGAGTITLATPQNIHTGASPTFAGLTLTGLSGAVSASGGVLSAGTLSVANGGTGQTSYTDGQLLIGNTVGNTLTKATLTGTANRVTVTNGNGSITLSGPQDIHTGASPEFAGLTLNGFFGAVSAFGGVLSAGTLSVANGGTGQTLYADGQLLIGNSVGNTLSRATLTEGAGVDIVNGNGTITISANDSANFANPTASLGLTAVNGTATTWMRSDAAPALSQSIAPTWTGLHTHSIAEGNSAILLDDPTDASGGDTGRNSPRLSLRSTYWNGSVQEFDWHIQAAATPTSQRFEILAGANVGLDLDSATSLLTGYSGRTDHLGGTRLTTLIPGGYGGQNTITATQNFGALAAVEAGRLQWVPTADWTSNANTDMSLELHLVSDGTLQQRAIFSHDGNLTLDGGLTAGGATVINNAQGATADFTVKGDTDAALFVVDVSADKVGVGTAAPGHKLHVYGVAAAAGITQGIYNNTGTGDAWAALYMGQASNQDMAFEYFNSGFSASGFNTPNTGYINAGTGASGGLLIWTKNASAPVKIITGGTASTNERITIGNTGIVVFNEPGNSTADVRMEGDTNANLFFLDASADKIGIGNATPAYTVDVEGAVAADRLIALPVVTPGDAQTEGLIWTSTTQKALQYYANGITQTAPGVLFEKTADTNLNTSTTETSLVGTVTPSGNDTIPANFFAAVGKKIRLKAQGYYSTKASTAGTLRLRWRLGGISGTIIGDTGAQTLTDNLTNRRWISETDFTIRTTGAGGTGMAQGEARLHTSATAAQPWEMLNTAAISSFDTTAAKAIVFSAEFNTSDASNSITCTSLSAEALN